MVETSTEIFEKIAEGLPAFLKGKEDMSVGELFKALGNHVLIVLLDVIKKLVVGVLRVGAQVLSDIKDVMNRGIHIPVFSALYKKILGKDLSVLDELSLIIAIPVTVFTKATSGKKPFDLGKAKLSKKVGEPFAKTTRSAAKIRRKPAIRRKADIRRQVAEEGEEEEKWISQGANNGMARTEVIVRWLRTAISAFSSADEREEL
jgi:hypothetical protein